MQNAPLYRCKSVPHDCHRISSEDSDSLLSYPSSTISISKSGSGRFTSKVTIRNNPPIPPPRDDATRLTRQQQRKLRRNQPKTLPPPQGTSWLHDISPPDSPCNSSSGCSSSRSQDPVTLPESSCTHHLVRHKSLGSLSASSDESNAWEESTARTNHLRLSASQIPPIPSYSQSSTNGKNIPLPPPPPPPPPGNSSFQTQVVTRQQVSGTL